MLIRFLSLASLLCFSPVVFAGKPYATAHFSSLRKARSIVAEMGQLGIDQQQGLFLDELIARYGTLLDQDRPLGALVIPTKQTPDIVLFFPLQEDANVPDFLRSSETPSTTNPNGVIHVQGERDVFLLTSGNWCYVASKQRHLESLPSDPTSWLDSDSSQDFVLDVSTRSVPAETLAYALDRIRGWFGGGIQTDHVTHLLPTYSAREMMVRELTRAVANSDRFRLGADYDSSMGLQCSLAFEGSNVNRCFRSGSKLGCFHLSGTTSSGTYRTQLSDEQIAYVHRWSNLARAGFETSLQEVEIEPSDDDAVVPEVLQRILRLVESVATRGDIDVAFLHSESGQAYGIEVDAPGQVMRMLVQLLETVEENGGPVRDVVQASVMINGSLPYTFEVPTDLLGQDTEGGEWSNVAILATESGVWASMGDSSITVLQSIAENDRKNVGPLHGSITVSESSQSTERVTVRSEVRTNRFDVSIIIPTCLFEGFGEGLEPSIIE